MANEIKSLFGTTTAFSITLTSLANATGRQSVLVDNTSTRWGRLIIEARFKSNATPTANKTINVYLLRADSLSPQHIDDEGTGTDAAFTPKNARLLGVLRCTGTASEAVGGSFVVDDPGPKFSVGVYNDSGQALTGTAADHWVRWTGTNPEVQ